MHTRRAITWATWELLIAIPATRDNGLRLGELVRARLLTNNGDLRAAILPVTVDDIDDPDAAGHCGSHHPCRKAPAGRVRARQGLPGRPAQ
ncbi:hypothetical protein MOQ72_27070 [Saccharopolyspora sp. K220]|uniref:hypothetical protein n=1 Tax=Saccharopolyspora soli TaxID=2926618 RepID=UPI001F565E06|nr:hypothetical protein [Saccharopolyspora soli]MCI2421110.1 hypothetical protein [Saccharopolyspora soli]